MKLSSTNPATKPPFKFPKIPWTNPALIAFLVILALFVVKALGTAIVILGMKPPPPAIVSTMVVHEEKWPQSLTAVARLASPEGAVLKATLAGVLKEIHFTSGQRVKKGDLLLAIDSDAERAAAKLAKLNYDRAKGLRAQNVDTQNDLDTAEANYKEAQAVLDKKDIRAPFDGTVGVTQVYLGQYINVGDPLVAIESLRTINADFGVPQVSLPLLKVGAPVELAVDAYPDEVFKGVIEGVNPRLDDSTLNATARGVFENKDARLLSGMFGKIKVRLDRTQVGVSIPGMAVSYSAYGNFVYVVRDEKNPKTGKTAKIARQAFVNLGDTQGDFVLVLKGLRDGDEIVTAGQLKLRNGAAVSVDNSDSLPVSKNPNPEES